MSTRIPDFVYVGVLISTHNPNMEFLRDQLLSITKQKNVKIIIYWSDDNSNQESLKNTTEIFSEFPHIRVHMPAGKTGVNENFLNLLKAADNPIISYYAFSDQDDIWHPEKIIRHIKDLSSYAGKMAVSHSKVTAFGDVKNPFIVNICQSHDLITLLAENCAQGCTMVMNGKARDVLLLANPEGINWYDWWVASIAVIKGELVLVEGTDTFYRVHSGNLVGVPTLKKRVDRFIKQKHGKNLSQALNLLDFAIDQQEASAVTEIETWIKGHTGPILARAKFALTDKRRRRRRLDDWMRRILDLFRAP